jgi:serine/threonine-protein kinase
LPLFDSGNALGLLYYVMPFVDGETLRARLDRERQLPVAEALRIAREVADALSYAHQRGVVHRDIKPENILLQQGHALVADFGIALAVEQAGGQRMTQTGLSLGTPQYMSPEQAMGERNTDARSDIYALGVVTYEMLAGEAPFTGPNAQAIVAKVLTEAPRPVASLRPSVSTNVDDALRVALEKLPADRFATALEFSSALAGETTIVSRSRAKLDSARSGASVRRWQRIAAACAALAIVGAAAATLAWLRGPTIGQDADVVRFRIPAAPLAAFDATTTIAISRDGRTIAYTDRTSSGRTGIYLRRLDAADVTLLPNTSGAETVAFSPDGASIAYATRTLELRVMSLRDRTVVTVANQVENTGGIDWAEDGDIYYLASDKGVVTRVPGIGGKPEAIGTSERSPLPIGYRSQRRPKVIAGGRAVAYAMYRGPGRDGDIGVVDLRTRETKLVAKGTSVIGEHAGYLFVASADGRMSGIPFDDRRLATTGPAIQVVANLASIEGVVQAALAADGTLIAISSGGGTSQLVWVTRSGQQSNLGAPIATAVTGVAVSPRGDRIALGEGADTGAVLLYDIANQTVSSFARQGHLNNRPSWTPDGSGIVYVSDRGSDAGIRSLWIQPVDGRDTARLLISSKRHAQEISWVAKSPYVAFREGYDDSTTRRDIRYFRPGADTTSKPFVATRADELNPALSPDGHWLAYTSDESGRDEVYVAQFPGPGERIQISPDGGDGPLWSHDGRALFYRATDGRFMSLDVALGAHLGLSNRHALFSAVGFTTDRTHPTYDLTPDDKRFLFVRPPADPDLEVTLHWFDEIAPRLKRGR